MTNPAPKIFRIATNELSVSIADMGAELRSIQDSSGREYLWQGNTEGAWQGQAPILFPSVGMMKNNSYLYQGQEYSMPRHGFARHSLFTPIRQTSESITFELKDNAQSREIYPFSFCLSVTYSVSGNRLDCSVEIRNCGTNIMPYKIGFHPGFNTNWQADDKLSDYQLILEKKETAPRHWVDIQTALFNGETRPCLENSDTLALDYPLFKDDAFVFENLDSNTVTLKRKKTPGGLSLDFSDFHQIGFWNDTKGNFICIEPWCGHTDDISSSPKIFEKCDIQQVKPGFSDTKNYVICLLK